MPAAIPAPQFDAGDARDRELSVGRQFFEDAGNPARGERVFAAKRCATCHNDASIRSAGAHRPPARSSTSATMVSVLWHHGPAMLDR